MMRRWLQYVLGVVIVLALAWLPLLAQVGMPGGGGGPSLGGNNTWTGTQTFEDIVITGGCGGCTTAPGGDANALQFNDGGSFGGFGGWDGSELTVPGRGTFAQDVTVAISGEGTGILSSFLMGVNATDGGVNAEIQAVTAAMGSATLRLETAGGAFVLGMDADGLTSFTGATGYAFSGRGFSFIGADVLSSDGGYLNIYTGQNAVAYGANFNLGAASAGPPGGSSIDIIAGDGYASDAAGGSVTIRAGAGFGAGDNGTITLVGPVIGDDVTISGSVTIEDFVLAQSGSDFLISGDQSQLRFDGEENAVFRIEADDPGNLAELQFSTNAGAAAFRLNSGATEFRFNFSSAPAVFFVDGASYSFSGDILLGAGATIVGPTNNWSIDGNGQAVLPFIGAGNTDTNTSVFQAYDVDDTQYRTFATLTSADVPSFVIAPPSGGVVNITATNIFGGNGGTPTMGGHYTIVSGAKDLAGRATTATTGVSTGTVTFSQTFDTAPVCWATNETTANIQRASATTTVLTVVGTTVSGDTIAYGCKVQ